MNTLKVKPWGKGQGDYVLINEEDFDPEVHEKLDDTGAGSNTGNKGPTVKEIKAILENGGVDIPKDAKKKEDFEALLTDHTASVKEELAAAEVEFDEGASIEDLQAMLKAHKEGQNGQ